MKPQAHEFIEVSTGQPAQFIERVRELLTTPRPFPMALRFMGNPDGTPGNKLLVEVVLDPKQPLVPIRLLNEKRESFRASPSRQDAVVALTELILKNGGLVTTPPPAPEVRPAPKPQTRIGDTLRLF